MSKKKAGGAVRQHKRPAGKRLGVKVSGGQKVVAGEVLVRQTGSKVSAGENVKSAGDHTLFALKTGNILFKKKYGKSLISVQI